ncbi:MAG: DUF5656 family protein [Anaerolineae bacterium]
MRSYERLGALVGLVVLGAGVSSYLPLPSPVLAFSLPGVPFILCVPLTPARQVSAVVALLISALVDHIMRQEPALKGAGLARTFPFWVLPAAIILWAYPRYDALQGPWSRLGGLAGLGGAVALVVAAQMRTLRSQDRLFGVARLGLNALVYGVALACFYQLATLPMRALLLVPLSALVSLLLALQLLESTPISARRLWGNAGLVTLLMAELAWALSPGALPPLHVAVILLVAFYGLTGILQQHYWGRLERKTAFEFGAVAALALALLAIMR